MPLPTSISDLSVIPGDNFPQGSDLPEVIDNVLREHASYIAQLRDADDPTLRADLASTASDKGAEMVAFDGGTTADVLDSAKPMQNYTALRAYTGRASGVRITSSGVAGFFWRDASDTTSTDNGGTVIIDASGRRWKRLFSGPTHLAWFGAKADWNGSTGTLNTTAIQAALDSVGLAGGGLLLADAGSYLTGPVISRHPGIWLRGQGEETTFVSNSDFTTLHNPTIWLAKSWCAVEDMSFTYAGWNSTNLTSLKTTRPAGNSYYGCHIASGYTELYTSVSSGVYNTFRGVTLEVVQNPRIENVNILGTAVHGIAFLNTVNAKAVGNRIKEFKGTGIYGFIAPGAKVIGNEFEISGDDAVFIGGTDAHLGGVWTPITKAELVDLEIAGNKAKKIGAKGFGASGYSGVLCHGNRANETRAAFLFFANEPSQGISACTGVNAFDNRADGVFGAFGSTADGYYYSNDIVTSVGGIYSAITLDGVDGFKVHKNYVKRSSKVTSSSYRGHFGTANLFNGDAFDNDFVDFPRNNIGSETTVTPVTSNVDFFDNRYDSSLTTFTRMTVVGANCRGVRLRKNKYKSLAAQSVNTWAAIWASPGSQFVEDRNEFDLPNGLDRIVTIEGPNSVESLGDDSGAVDLGTTFATSRKIRWSTAAPTVGTWRRGDIVFNRDPSASGFIGWVCVTAGTPGTWKTFGAISA